MTLEEARRILGLAAEEDVKDRLGEFAAARERIAELVRSAPNDTLALRYQDGLVEFDKAEAAGHPTEQLVPLQARALLELRQSRKLVERFGKTELKDARAQAELLTRIGQAQLRLGQGAEGRAAFERALAVRPGSGEAHLGLAWTVFREGEALRADAELAMALECHPPLLDDPRARELALRLDQALGGE